MSHNTYSYPDSINITLNDNTMINGTVASPVTVPVTNTTYDYTKNTLLNSSGSGYVYTTNGTGTLGYDTITIADYANTGPYWGNSSLEVKGDANFEGDVKIKGKSLVDSLEKIEAKLAILRPNEQLEEKWDQLRELRKQYMELEKEIIEKEKVWDILKK